MSYLIRLATLDDASAVQAIYAPYVLETAVSFEYDPPTVEETAQRIEATLARHPYLVLERDAEVLGYAYGSAFRTRRAYDWSAEASVYLRTDAHGRGFGRALYESLLPLVRMLGYRQVYAGISLPNAASVALHERVGFTHVGTFERAGYKFGAWHPVGWWQLLFDSPEGDPPALRPLASHATTEAFQDALSRGLAYLRS